MIQNNKNICNAALEMAEMVLHENIDLNKAKTFLACLTVAQRSYLIDIAKAKLEKETLPCEEPNPLAGKILIRKV